MKNKLLGLLSLGLWVAGCTPSVERLQKMTEEHPEIVFGAIEKNPDRFLEVVNKAVREGQAKARQREDEEEKKRMEEEFSNPKQPVIGENRAVTGPKDALITVVTYSDMQCPYCAKGYDVMKQVNKAYAGKVRFMFKHLPLDFHPMAMPAAKYFEAIALQSADKAYKFHDEIFENQAKLNKDGDKFLKAAAKKAGADLDKLSKDMAGDEVQKRIQADTDEAKKFGFSGTPAFLINGVSIRGALPFEEFKKVIDRVLEKNKGA